MKIIAAASAAFWLGLSSGTWASELKPRFLVQGHAGVTREAEALRKVKDDYRADEALLTNRERGKTLADAGMADATAEKQQADAAAEAAASSGNAAEQAAAAAAQAKAAAAMDQALTDQRDAVKNVQEAKAELSDDQRAVDAAQKAMPDTSREVRTARAFGSRLTAAIRREFGCADVFEEKEVEKLLTAQRLLALAGVLTDAPMAEVVDRVGSWDYLIDIAVRPAGKTFFLSALCLFKNISMINGSPEVTSEKPIARVTATVEEGATGPAADAALKSFVEQLAYNEVCPYLGNVTVTGHSTLSAPADPPEEYSVYCNHADQRYRKESKRRADTDQVWRLEKAGRLKARGDLDFTSLEETQLKEEDGCHTCRDGRQGGRVYTKAVSRSASIQGLEKSDTRTAQQRLLNEPNTGEDKVAGIRLRFLENGTYFVSIGATSAQGRLQESQLETAQGTCDPIDRRPKPESRKKESVELKGTWGPFSGKPLDKSLHDHWETPDDQTTATPGEKNTTKLEFDLTRR